MDRIAQLDAAHRQLAQATVAIARAWHKETHGGYGAADEREARDRIDAALAALGRQAWALTA